MTNDELDEKVLEAVRNGRRFACGIAADVLPGSPHELVDRPIDRALQRLRKRGALHWDGALIGWRVTGPLGRQCEHCRGTGVVLDGKGR